MRVQHQARERREPSKVTLSKDSPLRCVGSIRHEKGKSAVGLAVDGRWLACATADCVSAWRLQSSPRGGDDAPATSADHGGWETELGVEMRHEIASSQRRVVTHLALLGGLVLAAGESKEAKRRRESKGCLSQINPGVFVLACKMGELDDAATDRGQAALDEGSARMSDLEIPLVMAEWGSFGGAALMDKGGCALLGESDGQVVLWTLDATAEVAPAGAPQSQRSGGRSRRAHRPDADLSSPVISISRCCTLPPATGYGQLKSIAVCGHGGRFAVGALQYAVRCPHPVVRPGMSNARAMASESLPFAYIPRHMLLTLQCEGANLLLICLEHGQVAVWDRVERKLLHMVTAPDLCPGAMSEITGVAPWSVPSGAQDGPHFVISLDSMRTRAPVRSSRCTPAMSSQAISSQASAQGPTTSQRPAYLTGEGDCEGSRGQGDDATPAACLLVRVDGVTGEAFLCRHLTLFDAPSRAPSSSSGDDSLVSPEDWKGVPTRCAAVSCDSRYIVAGFPSGTVALWSGRSARLVALLRDPRASRDNGGAAGAGAARGRQVQGIRCVAMHPERRLVAAGRSDGWVDIWAC